MLNSLAAFQQNIRSARELGPLHDYLAASVTTPLNLSDLLRSQIVYSVSAFDKLMHDIVRIGMVDTFIGRRPATQKYLAEKITMEAFNSINTATIPPREHFYEQHLVAKFKIHSFQDPDKVADALSYIWTEQNKWQAIGAAMTMDANTVKTRLRLIVDRRNFIVHEADTDITTGLKRPITPADCNLALTFLENCGEKIVELVA
jgi:hypothetical protein